MNLFLVSTFIFTQMILGYFVIDGNVLCKKFHFWNIAFPGILKYDLVLFIISNFNLSLWIQEMKILTSGWKLINSETKRNKWYIMIAITQQSGKVWVSENF